VEVLVAVVVAVVEEDNMNQNCQLCHKPAFAEVGKTCKTCGMVLEDSGKEFCSRSCRNIYERLRRIS